MNIEVTPIAMLALNSGTARAPDLLDAQHNDAIALECEVVAYTVDRQTAIRDSSEEARGRVVGEVASKYRERIEQVTQGSIARYTAELEKLNGDVNRFGLAQRPDNVGESDAARLAERSADAFVKLLDRQPVEWREAWVRKTLVDAAERDDRLLLRGVYGLPLREAFGITDELLDDIARRHVEVRAPDTARRIDELNAAIGMLVFNRNTALRIVGHAPMPEPVVR